MLVNSWHWKWNKTQEVEKSAKLQRLQLEFLNISTHIFVRLEHLLTFYLAWATISPTLEKRYVSFCFLSALLIILPRPNPAFKAPWKFHATVQHHVNSHSFAVHLTYLAHQGKDWITITPTRSIWRDELRTTPDHLRMAREVPENGSLLGDRNAPNILMQQKLRRRPKWAPCSFLTAQFYLEYLIGSISSFHTAPFPSSRCCWVAPLLWNFRCHWEWVRFGPASNRRWTPSDQTTATPSAVCFRHDRVRETPY